jgi:tRNA G18 (ribose-2'-O)-methylase SpoU
VGPSQIPINLAGEGLIVLEGALLVERAIVTGLEIVSLYCVPAREAWAVEKLRGSVKVDRKAEAISPAPTVLSEAQMSEKAGYSFHRGVFALAKRPIEVSPDEALSFSGRGATVLVLPELVDPENLGSAFRNAAALGCCALLLGPQGPDPLSRRVLRVSMGASLVLPWARLDSPANMKILNERGYLSAACVLDPHARDLRTWARPEKLALVLGNEAFGLGAPWLEACTEQITLPMLGGTDSLNLATAAAVFLYALAR